MAFIQNKYDLNWIFKSLLIQSRKWLPVIFIKYNFSNDLRDEENHDVIIQFKSSVFWMKAIYQRSKAKQTRLELDNHILTYAVSKTVPNYRGGPKLPRWLYCSLVSPTGINLALSVSVFTWFFVVSFKNTPPGVEPPDPEGMILWLMFRYFVFLGCCVTLHCLFLPLIHAHLQG